MGRFRGPSANEISNLFKIQEVDGSDFESE